MMRVPLILKEPELLASTWFAEKFYLVRIIRPNSIRDAGPVSELSSALVNSTLNL